MVNRLVLIVAKRSFVIWVLLGVIVALGFGKLAMSTLSKQAYYPLAGKKVIIDAGHGGIDSGANSEGFLEKDVNLQIALRLREVLLLAGAEVVMTREDDSDVTEKGDPSKRRYHRDMDGRKNVMNGSNADVFISLHVNSCRGATRTRGSYVFYSKKSKDGKLLAVNLAENLNAYVKKYKKPEELVVHDPRTADYYLLRNAEIPAALIEVGFMTHLEEKKLLKQTEYQKGLAKAIADGLRAYFLNQAQGVS